MLELGLKRPLDLYNCRRHYAHWLQLARVPRARRRWYYGHQSGDVTDLYEQHEVEAYLRRDGRRLRWVLEHNGLAGFRGRRWRSGRSRSVPALQTALQTPRPASRPDNGLR